MKLIAGIAIAALSAVGLGVALSPTAELAISESCEPSSYVDRVRAAVRGAAFWQEQLRHLDAEVQQLRDQPDNLAEVRALVDQEVQKVGQITQDVLEDLYRKQPDLRPAPADPEAAELQAAADAREDAAFWAQFEDERIERLSVLAICRAAIERRLRTRSR